MKSIISVLHKLGVDFVESGNHHCTEDFVNIHCPFCFGSRDYHLGIHKDEAFGNCWRCGGKSATLIFKTLLQIPWKKAFEITEEIYGSDKRKRIKVKKEHTKDIEVKLPKAHPKGFNPIHQKYLESRGFDIDQLVNVWDIYSSGIVGEYSHRIIAPIFYNYELVSYLGRNVRGKESLRYKACEKEDERIWHRSVLYGWDQLPRNEAIVVEGITDVWKLGPGAVATFGINWHAEQRKLLKTLDKIWIFFDSERPAQRSAEKLAYSLADYTNVTLLDIGYGDPGELRGGEARRIVEDLIGFKIK